MKKIILIIFLLLASTMQAQLLDVFGSKHNYSWIEQLADSNKFYTSVGDWTLSGSGSITRNADSSLTFQSLDVDTYISLPYTPTQNQKHELSFDYLKDSNDVKVLYTINNQTDSTNTVTTSCQKETKGFIGGSDEDDFYSFDGSSKITTNNNSGDFISAKFRVNSLTRQQYILESLTNYKFSVRLETTNLLSVFSYTSDGYIVSMPNNEIGINTTNNFIVTEYLNQNGLAELYINNSILRQVAWNPSTVTISGNLVLACSEGITTDGTYIYTTDANKISKYDLSGNLITSNASLSHLGGVTYKDSLLYIAWNDNTWTEGSFSTIRKYNSSDLSFVGEDTIYAGRGAGAVTFNRDSNIWVVGESNPVANRNDHLYTFDSNFNPLDTIITTYMSNLGVQGISYRNGKYLILSHGSYMYLTDTNFNIEKVVYYPTWTELQDAEWISDDSLWICAKNTNAGKIAYPFTDGTKTLASFTGINIGADRSNNRKFYGDIKEITLKDDGAIVLDLNGDSTHVTDAIWYDASGNGNNGTVSGATPDYYPQLRISLSDTGKVKIKNPSIKLRVKQ